MRHLVESTQSLSLLDLNPLLYKGGRKFISLHDGLLFGPTALLPIRAVASIPRAAVRRLGRPSPVRGRAAAVTQVGP